MKDQLVIYEKEVYLVEGHIKWTNELKYFRDYEGYKPHYPNKLKDNNYMNATNRKMADIKFCVGRTGKFKPFYNKHTIRNEDTQYFSYACRTNNLFEVGENTSVSFVFNDNISRNIKLFGDIKIEV